MNDRDHLDQEPDEPIDLIPTAATPHHDLPDADVRSARDVEDDDLRDNVAALSQLSSRQLPLEELLTRVAQFAVNAIPGADGAGLTLIEKDRSDTIVSTASFVAKIDEIQYGLGEGPCVSAAATGTTIVSGSLGADHRWPRFGGRVARLGVHSALSLPLVTSDGVVGAMNVYAKEKHAFDDRAAELGELFAAPAAIAVLNAQLLAETQRIVARMQAALQSQRVIDQAVGILISRTGDTSEVVLQRLRTLSQNEHTKLTEVATQIVAEAARRARARHSGT